MKARIKILLGVALSVGLLVYVGSLVEWDKVRAHLGELRWSVLAALVLVCVVHFIIRSLRWRLLLPGAEAQTVSLWDLWDCISIGNIATQFLPLRAGEFLRPLALSRASSYPFATGFVSVVVERFFDLSAVLLSFVLMIFLVPSVDPLLYKGAWALGVLALGLFCFLLMGALVPELTRRLTLWGLSFLPGKLRTFGEHLTDQLLVGLQPLKQPSRLIQIIIWTVVVWLFCYLMYHLFFLAFGLEVTSWGGLVVGVVVALAVAAPSAPGFAGVYEGGILLAFSILGKDANAAAAYAIISHVFQFLFIAVVGVLSLLRQGVGLRELSQQRASVGETAT